MVEEDYKYCAYIDVLGYKNILQSNRSIEKKRQILENIYMNLFLASLNSLRTLKREQNDGLFIKSFSDSFYLESTNPYIILYSIHYIFSTVLGHNFYKPNKEYTPLLRGGIAYDWTMHFMDIGTMSSQPFEETRKNDDLKNVVGLGITRAYLTSEESKLSGMSVIISPEVLNNMKLIKYDLNSFECYFVECIDYLLLPFSNAPTKIKLFFLPVRNNEKGELVDLYELCWPVCKFFREKENSGIRVLIHQLFEMKENFEEDNIRHLKKTAELLYKSFLITQSIFPNDFPESYINTEINELIRLAEI